MTPTEEVRAAIERFDGVLWASSGEPQPGDTAEGDGIGWVKFAVEKSERGWRLMEFLAWAFNEDLKRSGFELLYFPKAAPPFLNRAGEGLAHVVEMLDSAEGRKQRKDISQIAKQLNAWRNEYWPQCRDA